MIEIREVAGTNIVEMTNDGSFTLQEHTVAVAQIEATIRKHGKIRVLMIVNSRKRIDREVCREDRKFSKAHPDDCERYAEVGSKWWLRVLSRALGKFVHNDDYHLFAPGEIEEARRWLERERPKLETLSLGSGEEQAIGEQTGWKGAVRPIQVRGAVFNGVVFLGALFGGFLVAVVLRLWSVPFFWFAAVVVTFLVISGVLRLCCHVVSNLRTLNGIRARGFEVSTAPAEEELKKWGHPSQWLPWRKKATRVVWTVLCTIKGERISAACRCSAMNRTGDRGEVMVATVQVPDSFWRFVCCYRSDKERRKRPKHALEKEIGWEPVFQEKNRHCYAKVQVGCLNWTPAAKQLLIDGPEFEKWICADGLLHCTWSGVITAAGFERLIKRPVEFLEAVEDRSRADLELNI